MMKRRESITLVGGACAAWPVAARGHLATRIGVLLGSVANASTGQDNLSIFVQGLRKLGWVNGENLQIEARYSAGDRSLVEAYASDLVTLLKPDVLFAPTTANLVALRRTTSTVPIVFAGVSDPVAQGSAPSLRRVALVFNPETSPQGKLFVSAAEASAPLLGIEVMPAPVRSTSELEGALEHLSRQPDIGLIFPSGLFTSMRAKDIVETVARYRIPAIYADQAFMAEGGLMYYYHDASEPYRLAPFYVDRILKGTKAGDLPVQLPKKFKFIVNRKAASAVGIDVPLALLLAADEVVE